MIQFLSLCDGGNHGAKIGIFCYFLSPRKDQLFLFAIFHFCLFILYLIYDDNLDNLGQHIMEYVINESFLYI